MAIARDLLKDKKIASIVSVSPDDSVFEAMRVMAEHNIGAVIVMDASSNIQGILSERDIVRKVDVLGRQSSATPVSQIMTGKVLFVDASQPLEECVHLMNERNIRHLPVIDGGELVGIISVRDAMRAMLSEQKVMLEQMEHYITGGGKA
jgi:CBS domain-containing protein